MALISLTKKQKRKKKKTPKHLLLPLSAFSSEIITLAKACADLSWAHNRVFKSSTFCFFNLHASDIRGVKHEHSYAHVAFFHCHFSEHYCVLKWFVLKKCQIQGAKQGCCQCKPTFTAFPEHFAYVLHFVSMFCTFLSFPSSLLYFFSGKNKPRFEVRACAECFRELF